MKKLCLTLMLVFLCALPYPVRGDAGMDSLIERILDAYGGERLREVTSYRMEGTVSAKERQAAVPMVRVFARPDRLYVDLAYDVNSERRYLDGRRGWRTDPGGKGMLEVYGPLLGSMVLQAARSDIPWTLSENREKVKQVHTLKVGGRMTIGLQINLEPGLVIRLYADPGTALIVFSQAVLETENTRTTFETAYFDFREVAGILFPHHEENWASGVHTGTTVIEKIEVNPVIPVETFRPEGSN